MVNLTFLHFGGKSNVASRSEAWSLARNYEASSFFGVVSSYMTRYNSGMGYPTKVQCISRKNSEQFYINFPLPMAQAFDLSRGEEVEWTVVDKKHLVLSRKAVPPDPVRVKKTLPSSKGSKSS